MAPTLVLCERGTTGIEGVSQGTLGNDNLDEWDHVRDRPSFGLKYSWEPGTFG